MSMRAFKFLKVAILSALVASAALVFAQDEKPQPEPSRQEEAQPETRQDEAKSPRQDEAKPSNQDKQAENKQEQQPRQDQRPGQERSQDQAIPNQKDHPEQPKQRHPSGKGGHIPDDKFRASFGRSHTFNAKTVIVAGQPQFHYGGYSFELVDAWPTGWAYSDDCYIDYIDGEYFLFDLLHPGVQVAIFVVM